MKTNLTTFVVAMAGGALAAQEAVFGQPKAGEQVNNNNVYWDWANGGKDWTEFEMCTAGTRQSPIDLSETFSVATNQMSVQGTGMKNYKAVDIIRKNGAPNMDISSQGNILLTQADGSQKEYETRYVQFKSPSEHCFDKVRLDAEMQIHLAVPGEEAISAALSVFWDQSAITEKAKSCPFIQALHANYIRDDQSILLFDLKLKSMLGTIDFREFYSYEGSLTNPPCTEGVTWTVVTAPRAISQEQVDFFRESLKENELYGRGDGYNIRSPSTRNGRTVYFKAAAFSSLVVTVEAIAALAFCLSF